MKYISFFLAIIFIFTATGCHNAAGNIYEISSFLGEGIMSAANDIENSKLPEMPEFTISVPSFSDMPEELYIAEYTHFISNMDYILVEETWYEAEADGSQPADNPSTISFNSVGTGTLWQHIGDGCAFTEFSYTVSKDRYFILADFRIEGSTPLDENWKKIRICMNMWFGTDEYILYITLADGTVKKYYSDTAERMENGSIKYSDGTISPSDIQY